MADLPTRCLKSDATWSGAASLASVSALHGIPLTMPEVVALSYMTGETSNQEGTVLVMGRALGYEAVAMEGEYENLPEVSLPMLVALRQADRDRYAVLFGVEETQVTMGDPETGEVSVWPRERFAALWTGSVVQLTPVEEERRALPPRLAELRDRVKQALRVIGWAPPYPRKIVMLFACAGVLVVASQAPHAGPLQAAWTWLLAAACAGSLWSWLASESCAACSYARRLAGGVPLAELGTALYALLLASTFVPVPVIATSLAIGGAVGAHAALVRELAKAKVACGACVFVAACAVAGAAVAVVDGAPIVPLLAAAAAMGLGVAALLPRAREREGRAWRATAEALARDASAEPRTDGTVRLVAFTRKGCTSCAFFHAAVKPALLATFGDAILVDERDLGAARTIAPILLVLGGRPTLFVGLPTGDSCGRVLDAVKQTIEAGDASGGEMVVHEA